MADAELAEKKRLAHERSAVVSDGHAGGSGVAVNQNPATIAFAWATLGIPLAIGIWLTLQKATVFFKYACSHMSAAPASGLRRASNLCKDSS